MSMPITSAVFVACAKTRSGSPAAIAAPPTPKSFATSRRLIQPCLSMSLLPMFFVSLRHSAGARLVIPDDGVKPAGSALLELRRESVGPARQKADIGADGDEQRPEREPAPRRL